MERHFERDLEILTAIGEGTPLTQRALSRRLGVALGLTNLYLKRLARKGYIKIVDFPRKPATRARLETAWGATAFDCYGSLEFQPIGWDTAARNGPTLAEDFLYAEVLDLFDDATGRSDGILDQRPGLITKMTSGPGEKLDHKIFQVTTLCDR